MYGDHGDDHDGYDQRRADRAEEPEGDEEPARDLGEGCGRGEGTARAKSEVGEELSGLVQPVSSKPSKEFLRAVRGHHQADDDPDEQESNAQRLERKCIGVHGQGPSL